MCYMAKLVRMKPPWLVTSMDPRCKLEILKIEISWTKKSLPPCMHFPDVSKPEYIFFLPGRDGNEFPFHYGVRCLLCRKHPSSNWSWGLVWEVQTRLTTTHPPSFSSTVLVYSFDVCCKCLCLGGALRVVFAAQPQPCFHYASPTQSQGLNFGVHDPSSMPIYVL